MLRDDENRRNLILRATTSGRGIVPRSVIVKATRRRDFDGDAVNALQSGFVLEWTALTLLAGRHGPAFLAGDVERGVIVIQDLGAEFGNLVDPLLHGPADRAERALVAYARSLGRLHAATRDCRAAHSAAIAEAFPAASQPRLADGDRWRQLVVEPSLAKLGGTLPESEIAYVAQRVTSPDAWLGLVHRDPCPDNVLLVGDTARLIDFEFASPGHVLTDAAYWRMGFPTCWCAGRVPQPVLTRMDAAYRDALPAANDSREMAAILFASLFVSLLWRLDRALAEDESWGTSTVRSRVLWYLEAAIAGAHEADALPGLRDVASRWRAELGARWPDSQPLALYPAFAG